MKKIFYALALIPMLFISCATTSQSNEFVPKFETTYYRTSGSTVTQEDNLTKHYMPNIASSITGENEWVLMKIIESDETGIFLSLQWIYQNKDWLFARQIEFYNNNGTRLYLTDNDPIRNVISATNVIEEMSAILSDEEMNKLYELASSDTMYCLYIGKNKVTREFVIKPKIKNSILATIDKYKEMSNK